MLRARPVYPALLAVLAASACGGPPPLPPEPPPPVVEVAKPATTRAHWVFPVGRRAVKARLDLDGGGRLYVGRDGLRQLVRGSEAPVEAPTVELDDLYGVLKDDKGGLLFVASDGDVLTAPEPLGPLADRRPGPLHKPATPCGPNDGAQCRSLDHHTFASLATGRAAILGVTRDGRLLRSADQGASWQAVAYAGAAAHYGRPEAVALDGQGHGMLLHYPQRVYVTHDDGATWKAIASPGIGAREIRRDGDGRLWLIGRRENARLDGADLRVTSEEPVPLLVRLPEAPAKTPAKDPGRRRDVHTYLSGDRSIELAEIYRHGKVREVEVGSAPLGDTHPKPVAHAELVGARGVSKLVAGYGADLVYLREDDDTEPNAPTTTVLRSADYGTTWKEEAKLKGADVMERNGVQVAVGPGGWTFVTALCPRYSPEGSQCAHRQIRPAGGAAFEDMTFTEELTPTAFAFDRERDRVYALGIHNGKKHVYESPLSQNRFTRTSLLDVSAYAATALTVDDHGTVRVLAYDSNKQAWELHRRGAAGEELPALYVPLQKGALSFAGPRGVLFNGRDVGWETANGGETWTRTGGVAAGSVQCTEAGCLDDDGSERVGWDIPAVTGGETLVAVAELPRAAEHPSSGPVAAVTPIDAVCKPSGPPATIAAFPGSEMTDSRSADVRWASVKHEADGKTSIVFGTRTQVRDAQLLPAAPKPKEAKPAPGKPTVTVSSSHRVLNDGVVAARYRVTTDAEGHRQPIDVELAWWSAATGRTHRHELKKVPPFWVSSYYFTGTPQIVDGGLLYQPTSGREVFFVRDDGKVETFSAPSGASVVNAERIGKGWLLADVSGGTVGLHWSNEGGKEWTRRDWTLDSGGTALMALVEGKATVSFSSGSLPKALFPVGDAPANDPPQPVPIDPTAIDGACDARASTLRATSYIPSDERRLRARVEAAKGEALPAGRLSVNYRVTHSTSTGKICTSAYTLSGSDPKTYDSQSAFFYPEAKGWSGWWFRRAEDPRDKSKKVVLAAPLACEPGPPEPKR